MFAFGKKCSMPISCSVALLWFSSCFAAESLPVEIQSFLKSHCVQCHSSNVVKGNLDLSIYRTTSEIVRDFKRWTHLAELVNDDEMPPKEVKTRPETNEKARFVSWIQTFLQQQASQRADDPGPVPARRLTAAEYEYCLQDITGQAIQCRELLPPDLTGHEGFVNTVTGQMITPDHLTSWLRIARVVAAHAYVLPTKGLQFSSTPVVGNRHAELEKQLKVKLNELYYELAKVLCDGNFRARKLQTRGPYALNLAFFTVWQYSHKERFANRTLEELSVANEVNPRYARWIFECLNQPTESEWVRQLVQVPMRQLPQPNEAGVDTVRKRCEQLALNVEHTVNRTFLKYCENTWQPDRGEGMSYSVNNVHIARDEDLVREGKKSGLKKLWIAIGDGGSGRATRIWLRSTTMQSAFAEVARKQGWEVSQQGIAIPVPAYFTLEATGQQLFQLKTGLANDPNFRFDSNDPELSAQFTIRSYPIDRADGSLLERAPEPGELLPGGPPQFAARGQKSERSFMGYTEFILKFAPQLVPYPLENQHQAALLGAGPEVAIRIKEIDAFYRDCILDQASEERLEKAWLDFEAFARLPWRQREAMATIYGLIELSVEQRAQAIAALGPDDYLKWDRYLQRPELPKVRWERYGTQIRAIEAALKRSVPETLLTFATKAWRRELLTEERERLLRQFEHACEQEGDIERAVRETVAVILVSPNFLLRFEDSSPAKTQQAIVALDSSALAQRLAFMFWSSLPDAQTREELKADASPAALQRQFERMKKDVRIRRFVLEFFGQWLGFKDFDTYDNVDRERYPQFTNAMRQLLFDQTVLFFIDLIQNDRPVTDLLFGQTVMLNPPLADFYGYDFKKIAWPSPRGKPAFTLPDSREALYDAKDHSPREKRLERVEIAFSGRRGVLGMGSLLIPRSKRLRTDPIVRGAWIYETLLGRHLPPPPEGIEPLPDDDGSSEGLTVRARLERHIKDANCASCHAKFDALGFALERFGPIAQAQSQDPAGVPIVDHLGPIAPELSGPDGLNEYLLRHRDEFLRNFCGKLVSYALGRNLLPSDEPLIGRMLENGARNDHKFSRYISVLLESEQFRSRRVRGN